MVVFNTLYAVIALSGIVVGYFVAPWLRKVAPVPSIASIAQRSTPDEWADFSRIYNNQDPFSLSNLNQVRVTHYDFNWLVNFDRQIIQGTTTLFVNLNREAQ